MQLYLVQHGQAQPKELDPARPLTDRGAHEVRGVAALAARLGLTVGQIRHSNKVRAEETAAILGQALSPRGGVVMVPGLAPKDDVRPVAAALQVETEPVMLVGHLPFLSRLAAFLVTGDPDCPVVQFRPAGVVCLAREEGRWLVVGYLTPEMGCL